MIRTDPYMDAFAAQQQAALQAGLLRKQQAAITSLDAFMKQAETSGLPIQQFIAGSGGTFQNLLNSLGLPADQANAFGQALMDKKASVMDLDKMNLNQIAQNDARAEIGPNPQAYIQGNAPVKNRTLTGWNANDPISEALYGPNHADGKPPLAEYGQETGDVHRPALIGDKEAVINKDGVKALQQVFGADFFDKLQQAFPNKEAEAIPDSYESGKLPDNYGGGRGQPAHPSMYTSMPEQRRPWFGYDPANPNNHHTGVESQLMRETLTSPPGWEKPMPQKASDSNSAAMITAPESSVPPATTFTEQPSSPGTSSSGRRLQEMWVAAGVPPEVAFNTSRLPQEYYSIWKAYTDINGLPSFEEGRGPINDAYAQYGNIRTAEKKQNDLEANQGRARTNAEAQLADETALRNAAISNAPPPDNSIEVPFTFMQDPANAAKYDVVRGIDFATDGSGDRVIVVRPKAPTYSPEPQTSGRPYAQTSPEAGASQMNTIRTGDIIPAQEVGSMDQDLRSKNLGPEVQGGLPPVPASPTTPEEIPEDATKTPTPEQEAVVFPFSPSVKEEMRGYYPAMERDFKALAENAPGMAMRVGLGDFVKLYNAGAIPPEAMNGLQIAQMYKTMSEIGVSQGNLDLDIRKLAALEHNRQLENNLGWAKLVEDSRQFGTEEQRKMRDFNKETYDTIMTSVQDINDNIYANMDDPEVARRMIQPGMIETINNQSGGLLGASVVYVPTDTSSKAIRRTIGAQTSKNTAAGGPESSVQRQYLTESEFSTLSKRHQDEYVPHIITNYSPWTALLNGGNEEPEDLDEGFDASLYEPAGRQ